MKSLIFIIFFLLGIAYACSDRNKPPDKVSNQSSKDTILKTDVIPGPGGKTRHAVYFLVTNSDTSNLRYNVSMNTKGEVEITVYVQDHLRGPVLSYREELHEQDLILKEASKDFQLSSLIKIWDFSLLVTGDLAIAITKQLPPELLGKPLDKFDVGGFLLTSKLTNDLNDLLRPYGKRIKKYVVEKAHFFDNSTIFKYNKIETPKSEIPAKILDAQVWTVIENNGD